MFSKKCNILLLNSYYYYYDAFTYWLTIVIYYGTYPCTMFIAKILDKIIFSLPWNRFKFPEQRALPFPLSTCFSSVLFSLPSAQRGKQTCYLNRAELNMVQVFFVYLISFFCNIKTFLEWTLYFVLLVTGQSFFLFQFTYFVYQYNKKNICMYIMYCIPLRKPKVTVRKKLCLPAFLKKKKLLRR